MDFAAARHNMVEGQIRPNAVTDTAVLAAMADVPREDYVPKAMRSIAYTDDDLSVGNGRGVMEAMVLARLLQAAEIDSSDVVLEIATATGYATAVLAKIANTVVSVDNDADFRAVAISALSSHGHDNAVVVAGDLESGYPVQAPYNVIFINGAVEVVPQALLNQLADGGRLVAVVTEGGQGVATLYTRQGDSFGHRKLFDANVLPLPGFKKPAGFVF